MLDRDLETPITQRALDWADAVASGEIVSCKRVQLAVRRFHSDLNKVNYPAFPFVFDFEAAEHLCSFVEHLPHIEGAWADRGETLALMGWQAFALINIAGWKHKGTGLRRFRTVYIEVPRKNGKSTLLSGVGLYFLTVDGERGAKVYSAAASTHQARIVFDVARVMALTGKYQGQPLEQVLDLKVEEHKIKTDDPASVFQPVASQTKSKDGKNPHCAIIDELHEHEKRDVWDSMSAAMGARAQPLLIAITTAGYNTAGVCYEQRRYLERLLTGALVDDNYFGLIFEADEGDEPGDLQTWQKANPSLGVSKSVEYLETEWRKAAASPSAMGEFLRKHLDVWTSVGAAALNMLAWAKAEIADANLESYAGRRAFIGVDLATRRDFSSVVLLLPDLEHPATGPMMMFSWHFLPRNLVEAEGNDHLFGWARDGKIITTPGAELDLRVVEALVLALAGAEHQGVAEFGWADLPAFDVESVIYDPQFAAQMVATWDEADIATVELRSKATNMNQPFDKLIAAVEDERLQHDGHPVQTWMAGNTLQKRVQGGDFIYPARQSEAEKIDGIVALVNAIWPLCALQEQDDKAARRKSYFESLKGQ